MDSSFIRARPAKLWPRLLAYSLFEGRPLTTRGRWINPAVFAGYRLWGALPLRNRATSPVFVMGVGRSGTTILGKILALHRDVGYLNEPKALWQAALKDDDLIGSYSPVSGRFRMSRHDATDRVSRLLHRYYSSYLRLAGCRRVVDKYPELLFRNGLIDAVFPDARKIVILRNGQDTCQSIQNWSARKGSARAAGTLDWWGHEGRKWRVLLDELVAPDPYFAKALSAIRSFTDQTDMAAVEWMVSMKEMDKLRKRNDPAVLFIRYERLAAHPRETMQEILSHCALTPDETVLRYAERVLRPRAPYPKPKLHPAIAHLFADTMKSVGYSTGS